MTTACGTSPRLYAGACYTPQGSFYALSIGQSGSFTGLNLTHSYNWYGPGGEILGETDGNGVTQNEYVFFGGERVAIVPAGSTPQYYVEDSLGTSRVMTTASGAVCYDADFSPYGAEGAWVSTCLQNYRFERKERDAETGNDDFGARYYTYRFGRWLSADWSSVPAPVPYANLSNPQTLNLYAMVADDPETYADLDGHCGFNAGDYSGGEGAGCSDSGTDVSFAGAFSNQSSEFQSDPNLHTVSGTIYQMQKQSQPISFSVQIENVGGEANPKTPITLGSGTVFALSLSGYIKCARVSRKCSKSTI